MIREATAEDTFRLVEMTTRFLLTTRYGQLFAPDPACIAALVGVVLKHGVIFVEDRQGTLVGMIAMTALPHPLTGELCAEEQAWWVEPEYRGGSIGPRLMMTAEEWSGKSGAKVVKMVAPEGSQLSSYYLRHGYAAVETSWVKVL